MLDDYHAFKSTTGGSGGGGGDAAPAASHGYLSVSLSFG